ncbi:hypothetical protein GCM10010112_37790 [Actinoplanes lobatus]|uniref:GPI inositol-deacylase PGAP1-like alpha/beta domain-containing protein n=1 Tax=Actinoplanes lobatus TaxID=113568 RepID=A0A7W7HGR3_9ACTN|nr:alpha/beta hydrolase [Actinoplanes lobatus]MBB4750233.1 hypothetical protein [Actinoplanes lobatus]GGN70859.1 hypothetical protein GCM10010112_37790 [Actinoplanes lobatus]GIE38882.1 hypothetical protein Alo02nite_17800 [Actinoplanes lobatus]
MAEPEITGGAGGVSADYADLAMLARSSDDLALTLGRASVDCHAVAADPDVLASAVLSPITAARFEAALVEALDGPGGLSGQAAGFGVRAVGLRAASASYEATDAAGAALIDAVRWSAGAMAPVTLPAGIAGLLLTDPGIVTDLIEDPGSFQRIITDHPGIVDAVVGGAPGLLGVLTGGEVVTDVKGGADLIAGLYPDGTPRVTEIEGIDSRAQTVPRNLGDIFEGLDYQNRTVTEGQPDQIDVKQIVGPDGTKSFVVNLPGTKDWNLPTDGFNRELNDLGTNVHVLGGDVTARERAIAMALQQAGASSTDPVMLVGHSQGGMVAMQAAHDRGTADFDFNVTHVVTAGSPVGRIEVPDDVQVLSLENKHDIVPHLDAADNPDRPNRTTVTFGDQHGTFEGNHGTTESYLPAGRNLDGSTHPSVVGFRNSASAFLPSGDAAVTSRVFELSREP